MSVPGGKTKASFTAHGGLSATTNALEFDATAMPADTGIEIRTLTRLVDASTLTDIAVSRTGAVKTTLTMAGGVEGRMDGFPLARSEDVTVDLVIDFSHTAEHLRTYPLVVTQYQDGQVVGRVTVDIVAVKELEDFFFGNPRSGEIHITTCPFWPALGPWSKRPFARIEDALARGYNGCAFCQPATDTG